jgi:aminoglycoside phosphotransferase (APT) family kinase protein
MTAGHVAPPPDREHVKPAHSQLADEAYARALLADAVPELADGTWRLLEWRLRDLRGGRRKPVALYGLNYEDGDGAPRSVEVAVKVFRAKRHRAAIAHDAATGLWADGFRPPSPLRVPRPLGFAPARSAVVSELGEGVPWADFLHAEPAALRDASVRAAAWLARLQRAAARPPAAGPEGERPVAAQLADLARHQPGHRAALAALGERLVPRLAEPQAPAVPSHGDFHPKNVLLRGGNATGIDLDGFALREPAFDVGWAMGQLLSMSYFRLGDMRRGAEAAAAFWAAYDGPAAWSRVAVHVARTCVDVLHYVVYALDTGEVALLDAWPPLAHAWLDSDGPEVLDHLREEAP